MGVLIQVAMAAYFGARSEMDAFLTANTLPQYLTAVLLSSLSFVFIPVFVDYLAQGHEEEAWRLASGIINQCALVLGVIALAGIILAEPLLRLVTPGLAEESIQVALRVARITWPTIVATGLLTLLTGIYQAQGRFGWPAMVPMLGAGVNLLVVLLLARSWGVVGVAVAATVSAVLQVVLLLPGILARQRYRLVFNWRHPGSLLILRLLLPLVLSSLMVRWTPIIDRYLASRLSEGAISHLGYASKLMTLVALLTSVGISTVVFPRMALNSADGNLQELRHTVSMSLRLMWMLVAPVMSLVIALALPVLTTMFQRGAFNPNDVQEVAKLLQVYSLALISMCLGSITGRTFSALKDTRILAIMGAVEAVAYLVYTPLLAQKFGVVGIAWGYVIYFNFSLVWQVLVIRYRTGNTGGAAVLRSFLRIGAAGVLSGAVAWGLSQMLAYPSMQLLCGGSLGLAIYLAALIWLRSEEAHFFWEAMVHRTRAPQQPSLTL
jgi:putative peptidoglycan lipid II flippase